MKRRSRKKGKFRKISVLFISGMIIILLISVLRMEKAVRPMAEMQSRQTARLTANKIISETVADYISENNYTYSDFAVVLYDNSGRTASVEALSENINRVQSELTSEINNNLSENGEASAKISLGSLSGSYLLSGRGPEVKIKICPVGDASVKLRSSFDSAGINQTRHRIYAEISADFISSIPLYSFETEENFELLLAETIIVGDVPDYAVKAWSN